MGILVQGSWRDEELPTETDSVGAFQRSESQFRNRITVNNESSEIIRMLNSEISGYRGRRYGLLSSTPAP
jgi:glutathionyl-hydroquinone reductase